MSNDKEKRPIDTYEDSELTSVDFEFVHSESDGKIHDEKFQSKPTTFAKDALRRFAKNKASVVGAVIIGILLLGSFLSAASPYKISAADAGYGLMLPKIRDGQDGFWDGTTVYTRAIDETTGLPANVPNMRAVIKESITVRDEKEYYTQPNALGHHGYYHVIADQKVKKDYYFQSYTAEPSPRVDLKPSDEAKIKITFGGIDGIDGNKISHFDLYISYMDDDYYSASDVKLIPVASNIKTEKEKETLEFDLGAAMENAGVNLAYFAQIRLQFPRLVDDEGNLIVNYILVESIELSCAESASEKTKQRLSEMSFTDAGGNAYQNGPKTDSSKSHTGYWQSNANRNLYGTYATMCSFRYDQYAEKFGLRDDLNSYYGAKLVQRYVDAGMATLSNPKDLTTFALTNPDSDECPIRAIEKWPGGADKEHPDGYNYIILGYRHFGFTSMPKFIFGTDNGGRDMLTLALACLKNSLLLAIITSAICLSIGLVWGSISGYFGGNVDLIMERITDILSGVPWIVVMTLVMILLGRTYITFGIAVCLTGWIGTSSRTRTQFYRFKGREYVLASRTLGASDARLIFRHILPNGLGTIVTGSVLMIPSTIFSEATLSYLGLGLQGTDSFGVVLSENQMFLQTRPALVIFPAIIVSLLMISFNLFGNGLRDALNPTLKGGEQ